MKSEAYHSMFAHEDTYWWYRVLDELIFQLIENAELPTTASVLDAGCGTGRLLQKLQPLGNSVGIDYSELAVDYCAQRGLGKTLSRGSLNEIPFQANAFDLIVSCDVLYHLAINEAQALQGMFRTLRPNGKLILHLHALDALAGNHDIQVESRERYTRQRIIERVEAAGFTVNKASYRLMFTLPLIFALRKLKQEEDESDFSEVPAIIDFIITTLIRFENWLLKFINLPIGSSIILMATKPK